MAWNPRILFLLALLCLLARPNLRPIPAEARESGENAGVEEVADSGEEDHPDEYVSDDENNFEESVGHGDEEEEGEEEDDDDGEQEPLDETDVVVLGSNNFTAFVAEQRSVLVAFHAPWCGHCQKLAPEWAAAATALKGQVSVAKIDATAHSDVSEEFHVNSYPTVLFFLDGMHSSYHGNRSKDAIVSYVHRKMSLTVKALMSEYDAESLMGVESPIAVAYFKKLKGPEVFELTTVARQHEDVEFYMTSNVDVASMFGFETKSKPALALLKNVPDRRLLFKGTAFKRKALHEFVSTNKLPLVIFYKRDTVSLISDSPIKKQVLCFVRDDEYWSYAQPLFEEVARAFRGKALFIRVQLMGDHRGSQAFQFFGITGENPIVIMAVVPAEDGPKYLYEGEFTVEGIKGFVEGFMKNKLQPYYKSQPIPEPNTGDVQIAVAKNFDEMVLDEAKDTLLGLYAPWCHHCLDLEPIYERLAKRLKGIPSLSIVKMDGVANEHPRAKPDSFPTILFYPAGKKRFVPITFDGERTVKGLYQFLKKKAAIPFALPKTTKPKASNLKDEL